MRTDGDEFGEVLLVCVFLRLSQRVQHALVVQRQVGNESRVQFEQQVQVAHPFKNQLVQHAHQLLERTQLPRCVPGLVCPLEGVEVQHSLELEGVTQGCALRDQQRAELAQQFVAAAFEEEPTFALRQKFGAYELDHLLELVSAQSSG